MFNYDNYYGSYQGNYMPSSSYIPQNNSYAFNGYPTNSYDGYTYQNQNTESNPFYSNYTFQMPITDELIDEEEMVDMTDEEIEKEKRSCTYNPYSSLLEDKSGAPNRLMMMLFNARITFKDKPVGCPRPQNPDGSFNEMALSVVKKMLRNELPSQKETRPLYKLLDPGPNEVGHEAARGYVVNNGTTWIRRREPDTPISPKKKFGNLSLVNVGGKKITGESNECIAFAKHQKCLAENLCKYNHNGSFTHQNRRFCISQLKGMCRNGKDCSVGYHLLQPHQLPVCHYFLKMMCSEEECSYLHVKHTSSVENCALFQKGLCTLGIRCDYIHRYNSSILSLRTEPKLDFNVDGDQSEKAQPLAQWFF